MPSLPKNTPPGYSGLTPEQVLDALDAAGLPGDGRILQLNSYENRVFQVYLESGQAVVAKFYRPARWSDEQILEEHAFAAELAAAEVPVVPPLTLNAQVAPPVMHLLPAGSAPTLAFVEGSDVTHRFSVSERKAGRAPELEDEATLRWLGRFLGRMHAVGAQGQFAHRRRLRPALDGREAMALLLDNDFIAPPEQAAWAQACDAALTATEHAFAQVGEWQAIRLHGDCHPGNILWREEGPHIVDLDDAFTGPAVQDLWMLVSGDALTMGRQLRVLLDGYRQFMPFDARELSLIEPLRTLRMVRHSAWLAERWSDPAFPQAFPWFGTAAYWNEQTVQFREQLEAMSEPPIALHTEWD